MRTKELEKLDEINKEKKLTRDIKEKIAKKALNNFLIALDILLLFIILMIAARNLPKETTVLIYKLSSVALFIFTLILFEIAYKKDDDVICIHGIEMFFLSITTLLTPYIFIERTSVFTAIVGAYFTAYYILKNLIIYKKEKNKYLREKNDIMQIVKKESKDNLIKEHNEKIKQKKEENIKEDNKKVTSTKKVGRPKKGNAKPKDKNQENVKQTASKKVGRPRKEDVQDQENSKSKNVENTKDNNMKKEEKTEPKKVGRPRKNSVQEQPKSETKKPGRPKKTNLNNKKEDMKV